MAPVGLMEFVRSWGRGSQSSAPPTEADEPVLVGGGYSTKTIPRQGLIHPHVHQHPWAFSHANPPPFIAIRSRANTSQWPMSQAAQTKPPPMPTHIPQQMVIYPGQPRAVRKMSRAQTPTRVPGRLQAPGLMQPRQGREVLMPHPPTLAPGFQTPRQPGLQTLYPQPPITIQAPFYTAVTQAPKPPVYTITSQPQSTEYPARRSRAASESVESPTAQMLMHYANQLRSQTPQPQVSRATGSNASVASAPQQQRSVVIPIVRPDGRSIQLSPRSEVSPRPDQRLQILSPRKGTSSTPSMAQQITPSMVSQQPTEPQTIPSLQTQSLQRILLRPQEQLSPKDDSSPAPTSPMSSVRGYPVGLPTVTLPPYTSPPAAPAAPAEPQVSMQQVSSPQQVCSPQQVSSPQQTSSHEVSLPQVSLPQVSLPPISFTMPNSCMPTASPSQVPIQSSMPDLMTSPASVTPGLPTPGSMGQAAPLLPNRVSLTTPHVCALTEQKMQRMMELLTDMAKELSEIKDMLTNQPRKFDSSMQTEVVHSAVLDDGRSSHSQLSASSLRRTPSSLRSRKSAGSPVSRGSPISSPSQSQETLQRQLPTDEASMSMSLSDDADLIPPTTAIERKTEPVVHHFSGSRSAPAI